MCSLFCSPIPITSVNVSCKSIVYPLFYLACLPPYVYKLFLYIISYCILFLIAYKFYVPILSWIRFIPTSIWLPILGSMFICDVTLSFYFICVTALLYWHLLSCFCICNFITVYWLVYLLLIVYVPSCCTICVCLCCCPAWSMFAL